MAIGQHFAGFGVDDFRVEVVFPHYRAVFAFHAFAGHARTHDFRQAVDVHSVNARLALDVVAHGLGPRLGAKNTGLERAVARIQPLALKLLNDHLHIRRRDHDEVGLEVLNQLHLLFGLPARHRHHRATRTLGAVVRAQTAGEQAIAVGNVDHVARTTTRCANRARHQIGPVVNVFGRVAHHCGLACGARRCMHAHHLVARHGKHAEGVVIAQVFFVGEGELGQVGQGLQIVRVYALVIKSFAVVRHVVVGVLQRPAQALQLQRLNFVAAGGFNGVKLARCGSGCGHV